MDDYGSAGESPLFRGGDLPDETFGLVVSSIVDLWESTVRSKVEFSTYIFQALTPPSIYWT